MKKLAIMIVGTQDSGKTTTINYFDKEYNWDNSLKRYCKRGRRYLYLYKNVSKSISVEFYFIPASPTETKEPLKDKLKKVGLPQFLLVAEQLGGYQYQNTKDFLETNGYEVEEINISKTYGNGIWEKWRPKDGLDLPKLKSRANEICEHYKKFIFKQIR